VAVVLDDVTREFLDGKNFATVATVNPDGGPQALVVWILRDGDTVLFSAISTRRYPPPGPALASHPAGC
jgi:hypothetical protein